MNSRFSEIGRIGRARGLEGWVRFLPADRFNPDFFSDHPIVYIKNERQGYKPLRIDDFYSEGKRNKYTFFVKFDMITTRNDADLLKDRALFSDKFDPESLTEPEDETPDLTGYSVIYNGEVTGSVLDVIENPAHQILEVKIGAGSLLIPFVDEYVTNINHETRAVNCINLDQLTDI